MLKKSMPLHCLSLAALLSVLLLTVQPAPAGQVLDEQYGPDGAKVELVKAKIRNGVLTLAVRYTHPAEVLSLNGKHPSINQRARRIPIKFKVNSVFYIAAGKRYHVLKDKEGNWLAAPVAGDYIAGPADKDWLEKAKKQNKIPALFLSEGHPIQIIWFKFPAPPEGVDEIEFQIPEVSPFDVEIKR
jgi:hypothetical protein